MASTTLSFVGEFPAESLVGSVERKVGDGAPATHSCMCCSAMGNFWTLSRDTSECTGQTRRTGNATASRGLDNVVVVVRDGRSGTVLKVIRTVARIPLTPSSSSLNVTSNSSCVEAASQTPIHATALVSVGAMVWVGTSAGLVHIFDSRTYCELFVVKVSDASGCAVSQMAFCAEDQCVYISLEGSPIVYQFDARLPLDGKAIPCVERYTLPRPQRPSTIPSRDAASNTNFIVCLACSSGSGSSPFLFVSSSDGYVFLFRTDSRATGTGSEYSALGRKGRISGSAPRQALVRLHLQDCIVSNNSEGKSLRNRIPANLVATSLHDDVAGSTLWIGTNCGSVLFLPYDVDAFHQQQQRGSSDKRDANCTADGDVQLLLDGHRALAALELSSSASFSSTPVVTGFIHVSRKVLVSASDGRGAHLFVVDANSRAILQTVQIPNSPLSTASLAMVPLFVSETVRIGIVCPSGASNVAVYDADGFFVPAHASTPVPRRPSAKVQHKLGSLNSYRAQVHLDPLSHLESSALSVALAEADQMLAAKDEEIRFLKNESQGYLLRTHDVKQQSTDFESEVKAVQKRFDEQTAELNAERDKVASLNETIGTLQREKKMLEEQVTMEQQRTTTAQQEVTRLSTTRLSELELAAGVLRGEKDDLQRRLKEAEDGRDYISNTFQRLLGDSSAANGGSSSNTTTGAGAVSDLIGQAVRDRDKYKAQVEDSKKSMHHLHRALAFKHMCENDLIALLKGFKGKACNAVSDERLHALLHVLLFRHPTMFDVANDEVIAEDPVLLSSMPEERLIEYLDKLKTESAEKYNAFIRAFTNPEDRKAWNYDSHLMGTTEGGGSGANGEARDATGATGVLASLLDRLKPNSPTQRQEGNGTGTGNDGSNGEDILTTLSKLLGTPANALSTPSVVDRLSTFLVSSHVLGMGGLTGISREEYLLFQFILDTRQELAHRIAQLHHSVHSLYKAVKSMCVEGDSKDVAAALRISTSTNGTANMFPSKTSLRQDRSLLRLAENAYGQTSVLAGNLLTMLEKNEYAAQLAS